MRKESKLAVFFALSLIFAITLLTPQLEAGTTTASIARAGQSVTNYSAGQSVIARITAGNSIELDRLIATGIELLEGKQNDDVFVRTTFAKLEDLTQHGWAVTLLYVRGLDSGRKWQYVQAPSGEPCSYSIAPTEKSFTAVGGSQNFDLTTGETCEWVIFSDPWIHVVGVGQGTGSRNFVYSVEPNDSATNRIGHIFVGGQVYTVFEGAQFDDVPQDHPFFLEIGLLSARGVTVGCGGGNFCPNQNVTRQEMAAFIIRALGVFDPPTPGMQRFADVEPTNQFYAFIEELAVRGITSGCGGGNYCPTSPIERQQTAALVIRGIGEFSPPTPLAQRFNDVSPSNPFYNFIDRMAELGITSGCAPNLFCPLASTTRGQMAVFLVRAFDL